MKKRYLFVLSITLLFFLRCDNIVNSQKVIEYFKKKYSTSVGYQKGIIQKNSNKYNYYEFTFNSYSVENAELFASFVVLDVIKEFSFLTDVDVIYVAINDSKHEFHTDLLKKVLEIEKYFKDIFEKFKRNDLKSVYDDIWEEFKIDMSYQDFIEGVNKAISEMSFDNFSTNGFSSYAYQNIDVIYLEGTFGRDKENTFEVILPQDGSKIIYGFDIYR